MLRLSLAARITMIVVVALTAAWIVAVALFYRAQDREGEGTRPSAHQILRIVELVEQTPREDRSLVLDAVTSDMLDARLDGASIPSAPPAGARPVDPSLQETYAAALGDRPLSIMSRPVSAAQQRFPRLFGASNALEFRVGLRSGETLIVDTRSLLPVSRLGLPLGFGAGLFGTLIALIALIIMHRETRPLVRLAAAVDRMELDGQPVLLPQARTSAPEIKALVAAFNRLQTRLSQLLRARMAMLGGISHDVRTFATRLRLRLGDIPDPIQRERAAQDIEDMIRLLDDALLASRVGAGELAQELVEFDAIVRAEVEDRPAPAVDLHIAPRAAGATVLGDHLALRRIVSNVVDNALKYGRAAHLALTIDGVDGGEIVLTIDDEGAGIPPDLRTILLEPFVRLESSRNRQTGGAGLGLAIVRGLVEGHGGSIAVDDAPTGGARFTIRLPVFRPA